MLRCFTVVYLLLRLFFVIIFTCFCSQLFAMEKTIVEIGAMKEIVAVLLLVVDIIVIAAKTATFVKTVRSVTKAQVTQD